MIRIKKQQGRTSSIIAVPAGSQKSCEGHTARPLPSFPSRTRRIRPRRRRDPSLRAGLRAAATEPIVYKIASTLQERENIVIHRDEFRLRIEKVGDFFVLARESPQVGSPIRIG